jgi:hypothetical protein
MAQLSLPNLPEYLYRYRPLTGLDDHDAPDTVFNREVAAIVQPYLWCGDFNSLNDPMEGLFAPTRRLKKHDRRDFVVRAIVEGKTDVGIAAFSDTSGNELMWTHYASNSSGICIEYRPRALLSALPNDADFVRVSYDDKPMYISIADAKDLTSAVKKVLSQKKFNWAYEREWRLLSTVGKILISDKKAIRRIYLGTRISEYHKFMLRNELAHLKISMYEMVVDGYRYSHRQSKPSHRF